MRLRELIDVVQGELDAAGLTAEGASVSLAFTARKDRAGAIELDFVDAGAMSKPRPEELHRLELILESEWDDEEASVHDKEASPAAAEDAGDSEHRDGPPPVRKLNIPPALPPKRFR